VLADIWQLGQDLIQDHVTPFHAHAAAAAWPEALREVVLCLVQATRRRWQRLLSDSYSKLPLSECAAQLGLSVSDCQQQCQAAGWTVSTENNIVVIAPVPAPSSEASGNTGDQLEKITAYIMHLESIDTVKEAILTPDDANADGGSGSGSGSGGSKKSGKDRKK
jgi:hypothetical protein